MNQFFCLLCSHTSVLDERFCCTHCGKGLGPWTVFADNLHLSLPEPEYASAGCYVPAWNAGNQKSTKHLNLVEPTLEGNNNFYEENSYFPLQIAGRNGYENCPKSEGYSQTKTSHDLDMYNNENQNRLQLNSCAEEGDFHDQFYDVGYAATSIEAAYDKASASRQAYLSNESSFTEDKKGNSDELLERLGPNIPTERGMKSDSFAFMNYITVESSVNLLSNSSDQVEDRHDKDNITPSFSSGPRGNKSVKKCVKESMVTANEMAHRKPETSGKKSKRWCRDCGRYFFKEWTFEHHKEGYCSNSRKPYKCGECGEIFRYITPLLNHKRTHTKPLKCTQCDYASARPESLKNHMKTHSKK